MTDTLIANLHPQLDSKDPNHPGSRNHVLIIAPLHNESEIIDTFIQGVFNLRKDLQPGYELRLLLIDDGSTDDTLLKVKRASETYGWLNYLRLTSNFGHQAALLAGLTSHDGWAHAIITMDGDMEHPLEAVGRMLKVWRESECQVVCTVRKPHKDLSFCKRFFSRSFYHTIAFSTGIRISPGMADFTLWDGELLTSIKSFLPSVGPLRIFTAWLPVKKETVLYEQSFNRNRKSRFTFRQNWNLAMNSLIRYSNLPLRLVTLIGFAGMGMSFLEWSGIINLMTNSEATLLFLQSLELILLGVVGSYFRRIIFSKDFPMFLVTKSKHRRT